MKAHASPQPSATLALNTLLTTHPEIEGLTWSIDTLGTLCGEQKGMEGRGRIIDDCAQILGGTPVHVRVDGGGVVERVTVWRGVPVQVWVSYSAPAPRRKLGTILPAAGAR
ncbi:hypothetical protein ACFVXE_08045 [Streptomyces sp. NPDC058231]|uniref:hypothetical protein n=1 Tax=Streptomyces sp. NPDC058231 TaxID=3346392 RepID=UPI0036E32987